MASGTLSEGLRETLEVFETVDGPGEPLTTNEVAEALPISRRSTYARLERLADDGYLRTKKVGSRGRVWWQPPTAAAAADVSGNDVELARLIDNTPGMVYRCLGESGWKLTFVSDACSDITGYDATALQSGAVSWERDVVHPDDRAEAREEITAQLRDDDQFTVQYRVLTADDEVRWVAEHGTPVADADERAFREGVVTDVTEQQTVERELAERERQLREEQALVQSILDNQRDIVYAVDPDGQFTRWNDRLVEVTGYADEEIAEMEIPEFIADEAREEAAEAIQDVVLHGESRTLELPLVTADGTEIPYEFTGTPIQEGGKVAGLVGVGRDVTERKKKERQLARHRDDLESELEEIYGRITDAFFALDEDWTFTHANDRAQELVDPDGDGLEGENIWESYPDAVDSRFETEYRTAMETQEATTFEAYYPEPLDAWFEVHAYPSETGLSVYFQDVTERKEYERELGLYETIVETIEDGVYVLDDEFQFAQVNDAYVEMTGYDREELLGSHCSLVVDQAVLEQSAEDLQQIIDGEVAGATIEADIHRKDGTTLPAESRFTALPTVGDDPPKKVGVVRDVSERRKRERELEESERRYRTIAEYFPNGIVTLFDHDFTYTLAAGQGFADLSVDPEDVDGRSFREAWDEETADELEPVFEAALDGEERSVELSYAGAEWVVRGAPITDERGEVFAGMTTSQNITERKEREEELVRQREQLSALNDINEVVHEITDAAIEQSTREEIESGVCERLAATDSYRFAWIGDVDTNSRTVDSRASAGTGGYLDDVTISVDPDDERSEGPTGRALRTGEMQTSQDIQNDAQYAPWRQVAETYDFRSSAAIPITHEGTVFGVLNVYADRPYAFEEQERAVIGQLGEIVGHAIAAVERKRALMSDEVVELRFHIPTLFEKIDAGTTGSGRFTVEETVPIADEEYLVYGQASQDAVENVSAIVDAVPHWEEVRFQDDGDGEVAFEARLSEPPVLSVLASLGGSVEEFVVDGGDLHMTLHLAPSSDTRALVDAVREAYPSAEMVARRQTTRPGTGAEQFDHVFTESLTDRQRAALRAAYHAGFFEWPREASGEDVAASLDVSAPTFHQHLRKAEQQIFESLLSSSF
ncbi:PAS domain S-box protein [Halobacterium wangiae]|uniref:PAS domain S-box protein n=1 Tax=Halobacterium wangiae TaxID=2902623 RepID=UPI001E3A487B|nr:PAS domain S-box protein [Halobacterium wangiae]